MAPSRIRRAAIWAPKTWALRLRRSIRSQPSSVTSSHSVQPPAIEGSPPALFTQTSSLPKAETAAAPDRAEMGEVRDVARAHFCAAAERLDLRAELLEVVAAARGEDEVRALRRIGERNGGQGVGTAAPGDRTESPVVRTGSFLPATPAARPARRERGLIANNAG